MSISLSMMSMSGLACKHSCNAWWSSILASSTAACLRRLFVQHMSETFRSSLYMYTCMILYTRVYILTYIYKYTIIYTIYIYTYAMCVFFFCIGYDPALAQFFLTATPVKLGPPQQRLNLAGLLAVSATSRLRRLHFACLQPALLRALLFVHLACRRAQWSPSTSSTLLNSYSCIKKLRKKNDTSWKTSRIFPDPTKTAVFDVRSVLCCRASDSPCCWWSWWICLSSCLKSWQESKPHRQTIGKPLVKDGKGTAKTLHNHKHCNEVWEIHGNSRSGPSEQHSSAMGALCFATHSSGWATELPRLALLRLQLGIGFLQSLKTLHNKSKRIKWEVWRNHRNQKIIMFCKKRNRKLLDAQNTPALRRMLCVWWHDFATFHDFSRAAGRQLLHWCETVSQTFCQSFLALGLKSSKGMEERKAR